jgi:CYTH domain-containing protein
VSTACLHRRLDPQIAADFVRVSRNVRRSIVPEQDVPEIERKFTVVEVPERVLRTPGSAIRQGYLSVEPLEARIRVRDETHELTLKSVGGLRRAEVNVPLTAAQFHELWPLVERVIEKTRRAIELDGHLVEVDVYSGKLEGLVVAEVEFSSEGEAASFAPPAWFGREVTDDRRYRNSALALADGPPM